MLFGPSLKVGGNRGKTVDINRMLKLAMILSVVKGNKMPVYATFRTSFSHLALGVKFFFFFCLFGFFLTVACVHTNYVIYYIYVRQVYVAALTSEECLKILSLCLSVSVWL